MSNMKVVTFSLLFVLFIASVGAFLVEDTCSGRCGETYNSRNECHCNDDCGKYGNCCIDYESYCESSSTSCSGRCGENYDNSNNCHCNDDCGKYGNCCNDYTTQCSTSGSSCRGRCGENYDSSNNCHCNDRCGDYGNCCSDYSSYCGSCQTFTSVTEDLWRKDTNRLSSSELKVNAQGQMTSSNLYDNANSKFFSYVDESQLTSPVFKTYLALLNNYDPDKYDAEYISSQERAEENDFLDAILATDVMKTLYSYLLCKGYVRDSQSFRSLLDTAWFSIYPRSSSSSTKDSSGFEHIMMGDYKSSSEASGLHYWLFFYELEKKGQLNYYGYAEPIEQDLAAVAFDWNGREKSKTSFFLRSSPAFDMAIYTLCYLEYKDDYCSVKVDGQTRSIKTFAMSGGQISTAYVA